MTKEQRMKVLNHPGLIIDFDPIDLIWNIDLSIRRKDWTPKHDRIFGSLPKTPNAPISVTGAGGLNLGNCYKSFNVWYNSEVVTLYRCSAFRTRRQAIEIAYAYLIKPFEIQNDRIHLSKDQFLQL